MPKSNELNMYHALKGRVFADFDNEMIQDISIVGLTQTDEVEDFDGNTVLLNNQDYVHLYMVIDEESPEYVISKGYVIPNPYDFKLYKWCCKLTSKIEYFDDYNRKFGK